MNASVRRVHDYAPENYQEVYNFHTNYDPHPSVVTATHELLRLIFKPTTTYGEGIKEQTIEKLEAGDPIIIVANHLHYVDQYNVASAISGDEDFGPTLGMNTSSLGKVRYFEKLHTRLLFQVLKAAPVYRKKQDLARHKYDVPLHTMSLNINNALSDMVVQGLLEGKHWFALPEGTRNTGNWKKLCNIEGGVGRWAMAASEAGVNPSFLTIGISYGVNRKKHCAEMDLTHPNLHIGHLIDRQKDKPKGPPFDNYRVIKQQLREALQEDIDEALTRRLGHVGVQFDEETLTTSGLMLPVQSYQPKLVDNKKNPLFSAD